MSSTDDYSGPNQEISSSARIPFEYISIALTAIILLSIITHYIRELICDKRQRQLATTSAIPSPPKNGGLDLPDISLLPKFIYRPSKTSFRKEKPNHDHMGKQAIFVECAICINELEDGDIVRVLPTCKHFFHLKCIDKWLSTHSTCPMCRQAHPDKVKLRLLTASSPLPQLKRCGTIPERKESINLISCRSLPYVKTMIKDGLPYRHGSISLHGSPCMFQPRRVLPLETRIEVRALDDIEIREMTEQVSTAS